MSQVTRTLPISPPPLAPLRTTYGGNGDAFVSKLNAAGSSLVYSTYLGGSDVDFGNHIAIDSSGNAYVTGQTYSSDFPITAGAFQTRLPNPQTGYVSKLNAAGSALIYSTYLGGSGLDQIFAIALDSSGNAYVTGRTTSSNFPTTPDALQTTSGGSFDAFVSKLNAAGTALIYSTYLGGNQDDEAYGIALDASGNAYVEGLTFSSNFPITAGAFQTIFGGSEDAFISKFSFATSGPAVSFSPPSLTFAPQPVGTFSSPLEATLTNTGGAALNITSVSRSGDFYLTCNCRGTLQPGASC